MDRGGWSYPRGELRVSDADRDRALSELSEAFEAGRITSEEFDERSGQALHSRTGKELTALLADLPVQRLPATRPTPEEREHRVLATKIAIGASAAAAFAFSLASLSAALATGPTLQQQEFMREMAARQGLPVPPIMPSPGFNWIGTLTPAAIALMLVLLIVYLRLRLARTDRA
jgi:hypothetical protein